MIYASYCRHSISTPTKQDGRAVLFAVAELLVCIDHKNRCRGIGSREENSQKLTGWVTLYACVDAERGKNWGILMKFLQRDRGPGIITNANFSDHRFRGFGGEWESNFPLLHWLALSSAHDLSQPPQCAADWFIAKNISFLCSAWFRQYHTYKQNIIIIISASSSSPSAAAAAVQRNCHNTDTGTVAALEKLHHRFTFFFSNAFGGPMILNVVLTNKPTTVLHTHTAVWCTPKLLCIQCHYQYSTIHHLKRLS